MPLVLAEITFHFVNKGFSHIARYSNGYWNLTIYKPGNLVQRVNIKEDRLRQFLNPSRAKQLIELALEMKTDSPT